MKKKWYHRDKITQESTILIIFPISQKAGELSVKTLCLSIKGNLKIKLTFRIEFPRKVISITGGRNRLIVIIAENELDKPGSYSGWNRLEFTWYQYPWENRFSLHSYKIDFKKKKIIKNIFNKNVQISLHGLVWLCLMAYQGLWVIYCQEILLQWSYLKDSNKMKWKYDFYCNLF